MIYNNLTDLVGNTPLLKIKCPEIDNVNVYVKMESFNPTGSIKDRACLYNILSAEKNGLLTKDKIILDASSGNMACALAYFGYVMGYKVRVICNSKITIDKLDFIKFFGAEVEIFGDYTIEGNRKCKEIDSSEENKGKYCFLDQLHNPANPMASYETLGPEILKDLPNVKMVIGSMGSGGSMCGATRFLKQKDQNIKIFTSQSASGTKIPGTGSFEDGDYITPFIDELKTMYDDTFLINQKQAEERTIQLSKSGVFCGLQAGGVLEALVQSVKKHNITGDVVMIIGDAGWKNMEKLKVLNAYA